MPALASALVLALLAQAAAPAAATAGHGVVVEPGWAQTPTPT